MNAHLEKELHSENITQIFENESLQIIQLGPAEARD